MANNEELLDLEGLCPYGLKKREEKISEVILGYFQKRKQLKDERNAKQEKLDGKRLEFLQHVEILLAAGVGATVGMIPGSLERVGSEMTTHMAVGGIVGAGVGASVPILVYLLEKHVLRKKIEKLDAQIKQVDNDIEEAGKAKKEIVSALARQAQTKSERKAQRKQFVKELER